MSLLEKNTELSANFGNRQKNKEKEAECSFWSLISASRDFQPVTHGQVFNPEC